MKVGAVYREKRLRPPLYGVRHVGVVTAPSGGNVRIQSVQLIMGVWFRKKRGRVLSIELAEFKKRFVIHDAGGNAGWV